MQHGPIEQRPDEDSSLDLINFLSASFGNLRTLESNIASSLQLFDIRIAESCDGSENTTTVTGKIRKQLAACGKKRNSGFSDED